MNTTVPIPSFSGGVSQQPDSLRFSNQFPQVDNWYLNPLTGAERRPGSVLVGPIGAFAPEAVGHLIDRDSSERYILVAKSGELRVYDADTAFEYDIVAPGTTTAANFDYVDYSPSSGYAHDKLRFLNIADYTFVLNRGTTVAMDPAVTAEDSGDTTGHAFIWIRKGNYNRSFDFIIQDGTNPAFMVSAQTGSGLVSSTGASISELDFRTEDRKFVITALGAAATTWTLSLTFDGVAKVYTHVVTGSDTIDTVAKALVAKVNAGQDATASDAQIATAYYLSDGSFIARGSKRNKTFTLSTLVNSGAGAATVTLLTDATSRTLQSVDTGVIAARIAGEINELSSINAEVFGSVIRLTSTSAITRIETSYDATLTEVSVINRNVANFDGLPDTCQHDYVVEVRRGIEKQENSASTIESVYYSQFVADLGSGFGKGRWVEGLKPGSLYKVDADTLPHQLVRKFGGTQTFVAASAGTSNFVVTTPFYASTDLVVKVNGVTTTNWSVASSTSIDVNALVISDVVTITNSATFFEFGPAAWDDKQIGSDITVLPPSFVGGTLNDLAFFKNRLVFLSGANVVMSETFRYFNVWRTTLLAVVDTDTIDVQAAHDRVVSLDAGVPFGDAFVLFDNDVQFTLKGTPLSPRTVSITASSKFSLSLASRPLFEGVSILAPFVRDTFGGVREMLFTQDVDIMDGDDITIQCPTYIKGQMLDFCGSAVDGLYFGRGDFEDSEVVYVYKTIRQARERQQSAWSRWIFTDNFNVRFVGTAGSTVYFVLGTGTGNPPIIVKMSLDPKALPLIRTTSPPGPAVGLSPYLYKLDALVTSQAIGSGNIVYDVDSNTTEITLPWNPGTLSNEDIWVIQSRAAPDGEFGRRYPIISRAGAVMVVKGEAVEFEVGVSYLSVLDLGKPSLRRPTSSRQDSEVEKLTGSTLVVGGKLRLQDSGFVEIVTTSPYRDESRTTITGKEVGNPAFQIGRANLVTGEYQFWVNLPRDEVTVQIQSRSPLPLVLAGAEWQIRFDSTFNSPQG